MKLSDVLALNEEFKEIEKDFNQFFKLTDPSNKDAFIEYERKFVELRSKLRDVKAYITRMWTMRDDKAASAIKFRLTRAIFDGQFEDIDGEIYSSKSISNAEKLASASLAYKEFIDQRATYREALSNITDMRDDINGYINLIKDKIK